MKKDYTKRIALIGAGAAGLTAAETLKEKGYQQVTIFEKESFAGGKCRSIFYEGRTYELGAGIIAGNNDTILQLVEKTGVALSPLSLGEYNFYNIETGGLCTDTDSLKEQISFWWQLLLKYRRLCRKNKAIISPGFTRISPDLGINFSEWATQNNLELVEKNLECCFTGFGYGYWEEIPAAYVLKYYSWDALKAYLRNRIFTFPEGIQSFWSKIAEGHNVQYNSTIQQIQRNNVVTIETGDHKLEFDILILTTPLDEALYFLDHSDKEKELFSKIIYTDYQTCACVIENFPQKSGFIPRHFNMDKRGHPVLWYKRYSDSNFYTMYILGDFQITQEKIIQNVENTIQQLGGTLKKVHTVSKWKYFPHVNTKDIQDGFYDQLENLQGQNNTYYIGELFNFSTVDLSAAYAKDLIERYF